MENKRNSKKEISIPLFIPIFIIFIIISANISSSKSKAIASTNESIIENNFYYEQEVPKNLETEEEIHTTTIKEGEEEKEQPVTNNEKQNTIEKSATYTVDGEEYTVIGALNIPSLNIKYPILSETSTQLLKVSLTKYWGANPNEVGNMVVVGHNYKDNKFFSNLAKIKLGGIVNITDLTGKTLVYKVYDTYVIDEYDNACTSQLTDGKTEITLITCHYEKGSNHVTKRFVVKARAD